MKGIFHINQSPQSWEAAFHWFEGENILHYISEEILTISDLIIITHLCH